MFQPRNDGFSLVEVIIAVFLFGLISLAVLPLLIAGIGLSASNRDVVAATTLANDRLAQLREEFPTSKSSLRTCDQLLAALRELDPDDAGNPALTARASADPDPEQLQACPVGAAAYPRAVLVTVVVTDDTGAATRVPTRIMVGSEK